MIEVCKVERIIPEEKWTPFMEDEWFILKVAGTMFWFNSCLDIVDSPFIELEGDLRPFGNMLNDGVNGIVEWEDDVSYRFIYFEDGRIPYDREHDIDYKELLLRLLLERGYIEKKQ